MGKPLQRWKVLPHGRLAQIDENIMTVVRLTGSRLAVFSAIALDDDEMAGLEAFGRPAFLIVPSDKHRLDAKIWKDRYPAMQVVAPAGAREKVEEVVKVDTAAPQFDDQN